MTMAPAMLVVMTDLRDQQIAWLDHIRAISGLTLTDIARRSKIDPSTLSRFANRNESGHTLTARTVQKIETATGVPAYERRQRQNLIAFAEEEAVPFEINDNSPDLLIQALKLVVSQSNSVDLWQLKSSALSAIGYDQGDVLLVDRDRVAKPGDAVCAQRYDWRRGTAETIFRVLRTPYLVTATASGEPGQPEVVDNENLIIKGVVLGGLHLAS